MADIHIALLGKEVLPVFYPIRKYNPDKVYLISTKQNADIAERLSKVVESTAVKCTIITVDAFDVLSTMNRCEQIEEENTGEGNKFMYNITGGTKPMAIGALLAAQKNNSKVVYTNAESLIDFDDFHSEPLDCRIDSQTIFALQGQQLKAYEVYVPDAGRTECAKEILDFMKKNEDAFHKLINVYNRDRCIPNTFYIENICYSWRNKQIIIEQDDVDILSLEYDGAFKMLFEGRWWETLVADAIYKWSDNRFELWSGVKFRPVTKSIKANVDKNEVDILINTGNTFIFVECKSGTVTQNDIYKMNSIRETYGSSKSKSVLVSYRYNSLRPDIREKAKELGIEIIAPTKKQTSLQQIPIQLERILNSILIK